MWKTVIWKIHWFGLTTGGEVVEVFKMFFMLFNKKSIVVDKL